MQALYVGYFGRAGDPAGANYWIGLLNNHVNTLAQQAASFATQPEAKAKYPYLANPLVSNPDQFIKEVYLNLFNREPDPAGQAYWSAKLIAAGGNPNAVGQFILDVISGATGVDSACITNKVSVSRTFTEAAANNAIPWSDAVAAQSAAEIASVTADPATVVAANKATAAFLAITVTVAEAALLGPTQPYNLLDTSANEANATPVSLLNRAVNITSTDTATVAQATIIATATNSGTTNIASVTDAAAAIAGSSNSVLNKVSGAVTATTAATGAQAINIGAFTHAVIYSVNDTAAGVASAAGAGLNEAVNITATGIATVAQATTIAAATNSGTKTIAAVTDTAAALAGTTNAILNLVTGAVTASTDATAAQAVTLSGFTKAVVYSITDTVANIVAVAGAALNDAVNISATGVATVAQATTIEAATNTGTTAVAALTDTAALIAASSNAVLNIVTGLVTANTDATGAQATALAAFTHPVVYSINDTVANVVAASAGGRNEAVNITATGTADVAQATTIATSTNSGTTSIGALSDTAANIAASSNAVLNDVTGTVTATTDATGAQATSIAAFTKPVVYNLTDTVANVVAASAGGRNEAVNITATGTANVAQATTIEAATNSGTTSVGALSDTAANIANSSNPVLNIVTGTVTATTDATGAQAITLSAFTKAIVYSVTDTVAGVLSAIGGGLNDAVNVTTTGVATATQANTIMGATNSGATTIANVTDTSANAAGLAAGANDTIVSLVVTDTANVAQATFWQTNSHITSTQIASLTDTAVALSGSTNAVMNQVTGVITASTQATGAQAIVIGGFTHAVVYSVTDTAAGVASAAGAGLNEAVNITATGIATVANATTIFNATNSGTKTIAALTDSAANIAGSSNGVLDLVTGTIIANTNATGAQSNTLSAFNHAIVYSVSDTAANLVAAYGSGNGLNDAVDVTSTGVATAAQANTIMTATNSGQTTINNVTDTAGNAATLAPGSNDVILVLDVTNTANIAQATSWVNNAQILSTTINSLADTAGAIAGSSDTVLNHVTGLVTATDAATGAQAIAIAAFTKPVVYSVNDSVAGVLSAVGPGLDDAVNITANGNTDVAGATAIWTAINVGTTTINGNLNDTALNISNASGLVLDIVTGLVTATTPATVAEANILAGFTKPVVYNISDIGANIVAGAGLNDAVNILVTGTATTVAEANTVFFATNSGAKTIENITDSAANIAGTSDVILFLVTGTVTADTPATAAQAVTIAAFVTPVVYNVQDLTSVLAVTTGGLTEAVDINGTGIATAAEAQVVMNVANGGLTTIDNVTDNAVNAAGLSYGANDTVSQLIVTTDATVAQASNWVGNSHVTSSSYSLNDTLANEAGAASAILNGADNITATGSGSAAQAQTVIDATNAGSTTIAEVTDTSTAILAMTFTGNDTVTLVTVTDAITVATAESIINIPEILSEAYNLNDTLVNEAAAAAAILNGATDITATGVGDAAQAQIVMNATNGGNTVIAHVTDNATNAAGLSYGLNDTVTLLEVTGTATVAQAGNWVGNAAVTGSTYSLNDSLGNEAGAGAGILDGATDITATGSGNAAQAQTVMSATNTGSTLIAEVVDGAAAAAGLVYDANDTITSLIVNTAATVAQANTWFGNTHVTGSTYFVEDWYANIEAAHGQAVLASATSPGVGVPAVQADGDNLANNIDMSLQTVSVYVNALGGNDTIIGSTLAADTVNGGTGADTITLNVDTHPDVIVQAFGDSAIASAVNQAGAGLANGDTFVFGFGVDTVTSFKAGAFQGDVLTGSAFQTFASAAGLDGFGFDKSDSNAGSNAVITFQGTWNAGTSTFTLDNTASGLDTLVVPVVQGLGIQFNTSTVVLIGTTGLAAANFEATGADFYATINASTQSLRVFGPAAGVVSLTANGGGLTILNDVTPVTPFGTYNAAALKAINVSSVTGQLGTDISIDGTALASLVATLGSSGNDTFTFATEDLGGVNNTISGGGTLLGGVDKIVLSSVTANMVAANAYGGGGNGGTFSGIGELDLLTGTGAFTIDIATAAGTVDLAVDNQSATAAATVFLGGSSGVSFTTKSSGVQTITVGEVTQSVTTGTNANDVINLDVAGAFTGTFAMGDGANDQIVLTGGNGTYDLTGATVSGVETITDDGSNVTLVLNTSVLPTTSIVFGAGTDTLQLTDGTYTFGAAYLTFGGAGATLDLDAVNATNVTVSLFQAGLNNVSTIIGESTSPASVTTLNMQDSTDLHLVTVTNVDTVTMGGVLADQTLNLAQAQFTATNFTTVTGAGDSNLVFGTATTGVNLTNTTISGFDFIDASNVTGAGTETMTIDSASISNAAALTFKGAADTILDVTLSTTATKWTVTTLDQVTLQAGVTFTVSDLFLAASLDKVIGQAGFVDSFAIQTSSAGASVNMGNIATVTNLDSITVTDGTGNNTITTSAVDAVRSITSISLANGGSDIVDLNNTAIATGATSATITGFLAGNSGAYDQISSQLGGTSISDGVFFERTSGVGTVNLADSSVLAANTSWFTAVNLNNATNVLATITGNGVTGDANAAATLVVYDGLGHAGIYQLLETTGAAGAFDECELVGVVTTASNSLTAVNFV